jgi:hypothetical protein
MQVKLYLCLIKHSAININGGMVIVLHAFLESSRDCRCIPPLDKEPRGAYTVCSSTTCPEGSAYCPQPGGVQITRGGGEVYTALKGWK